MTNNPTLEEQIATAGLTYGRRRDITYRTGLVLQVLGAAVLAVLYPLESPFYTIGIMLFEAGVLVSGIFLLARRPVVKSIILGPIVSGIALQVAGFSVQEQHAGLVLLSGIGLVCAGAAGMAGMEAYRFSYREGWVLMAAFPLVALVNLLGRENSVLNTIGFSIIFLLLLFLVGKKLQQPLTHRAEVRSKR